MIDMIAVSTWEACSKKIQEIRTGHPERTSEFLFRGQSNADWRLTTTLERRTSEIFSFMDYYRLAGRILPEIEAESGLRWNMPTFDEISSWAKSFDHRHYGVLAYEYLAHLRHNGFPSPLLDWSRSPHVAAYFAFSGATTPNSEVAIYVYLESPTGLKGGGSGDPAIRVLGPYVRAHKRHFRQQSAYTVCANFLEGDGNEHAWRFASHEDVFSLRQSVEHNLLWKIVLPAKERGKVLKLLDDVNMNAYSLFGSEESLMEKLAYREVDLKPLRRIST